MAHKLSFLKMLFLFMLPLSVSGCGADLGVFGKEEGGKDYFESFGDMKCLFDGGDWSYDLSDSLYNEKTAKEFKWEKEEYEVKDEQYLYLILPMKDALKIQALVLFVNVEENAKLEISAFYYENESQTPQKIKYLSSPDTEIVHDEETGEDKEVEIEYDDPPKEVALTTATGSFYKGEWNNFVLGNFNQYGYNDGYLHTGIDGLLYIRFENNSGFNVGKMEPVTFNFINLMIRAV